MVGNSIDSRQLQSRKGGSGTLDLNSSQRPTECASKSKGQIKQESEIKGLVWIVTEPLWNWKKSEIGGGYDVPFVLNRDGGGLWAGCTYPGCEGRGGHDGRGRLGEPG
jgi:hypothetical protein